MDNLNLVQQKQQRISFGIVWVLGVGAFLVSADNRAIAPILPAISDYFHVGSSMAGLLVTAYSIPYGLFQLFYGPLAERIGKIRTIMIALFLFGVGTVLCGLVTSFSTLLILRFVTGMFAAGIIPIALAQIGDSFEFSLRQKALGFFLSMSTSGQILGMVIGGIITEFLSWKMLFILLGMAAFPALFLLREKRTDKKLSHSVPSISLREQYRLLFQSYRTWIVYGMVFLEGLTLYGGFTFIGVYGNQTLGLSFFQIGLIIALYSVSALVSSFNLASVADRVKQHNMPLLGSLCMVIGFGLMWLSQTVTALWVGLIIAGVGYSFCHTTLQTYATELLPKARGTAMSLFAFSLFFGSGLGPVWLGLIYDHFGPKDMLGALSLSLILFSVLSGICFKRFE